MRSTVEGQASNALLPSQTGSAMRPSDSMEREQVPQLSTKLRHGVSTNESRKKRGEGRKHPRLQFWTWFTPPGVAHMSIGMLVLALLLSAESEKETDGIMRQFARKGRRADEDAVEFRRQENTRRPCADSSCARTRAERTDHGASWSG